MPLLRDTPHTKLEFAARVAKLPHYPAATSYAKPDADEHEQVLLASNESPYPPLRAVQEAIAQSVKRLNRYMDPRNMQLRLRLSEMHDVPVDNIAVGNGSCDILLAAGEVLLEPKTKVVYGWPSFSLYRHLAAATGAKGVEVPLDREEKHNLDTMLSEAKRPGVRLVIICNPNNPTSTAVSLSGIESFLAEVPDNVCVIVDEAYCEFNRLDDPQDSIALLQRYPNLVLLRTFSKVYGICGLRVGFALCGSKEMPAALDRVRQPFSCGAVAQAAAEAALEHQDVVRERVRKTAVERELMDAGLRELGIEPATSQANFCWFLLPRGTDESDVMTELSRRNVIVRGGSALGQEGALRVTYGLPEQNRLFLDAFAKSLGR